jgi:hypothetical protein
MTIAPPAQNTSATLTCFFPRANAGAVLLVLLLLLGVRKGEVNGAVLFAPPVLLFLESDADGEGALVE